MNAVVAVPEHQSLYAPGMVQRLAAYVVESRGQPLDAAMREAVLRCLLDLLGSAAAGTREPGVVAARRAALDVFGAGDSPIWFTGSRSSVIGAAWANSTAAAALDLDDGHRLARGHPGAAVIPAVLAVAGEAASPVADVLAAVAIGYEVGVTIAAARTTYGNTGTWSAFAVIAAVAALRRSPAHVIEHAFAIAGESGPNQLFASAPAQTPPPQGSDVKEGIPWSVVTGLASLKLAEHGYTGPRNILDSPRHYQFPVDFECGKAGYVRFAYFKVYACCRHIHAPLDACLHLLATHRIDPGNIDEIEVETYGGALRISNLPEPQNLTDIQYSTPYCLALAAMEGPLALLPLTGGALDRPDVSRLARKVVLRLDADMDARFPAETLARVRIVAGGTQYTSDVTRPRGEASHPLSWGQLEAKVRGAMRFVASVHAQDELIQAVSALRQLDDEPLNALLGNCPLESATEEAL